MKSPFGKPLAPLKGLGQHFLVNMGIVNRIAETVERLADGSRLVVEIGPGPGVLTQALLDKGLKVVALEFDARMVAELTTRFARESIEGRFRVFECDAMKFDLSKIAPAQGRAVICGNLPYNVGSQIVFRFLEECSWGDRFCYMLQKEVVQRFLEREGGAHFGVPSLKMAWSTETLGQFWVKPGSFSPPPKVDSGVFWSRRLGKPLADPLERGGLYDRAARLAHTIFQKRRKMLRNSLPELDAADPRATRRPEELSAADFLELAERFAP